MPFDPALPADGSTLSSAVMRSQLRGLKALVDEISVGRPDRRGEPGLPAARVGK